MKFKFLCFFSLVFCSCNNSAAPHFNEKNKAIHEVRKKAALQIFSDTKLTLCGTGVQAMDQIQMLALSLDCGSEIDIVQGRKLLLHAVNSFLSVINAEEKIRPYLASYPFGPKNVEIRIFIRNIGNESNKLHAIGAVDGVLEYYAHTSGEGRLDTVFKETYEEAMKKN